MPGRLLELIQGRSKWTLAALVVGLDISLGFAGFGSIGRMFLSATLLSLVILWTHVPAGHIQVARTLWGTFLLKGPLNTFWPLWRAVGPLRKIKDLRSPRDDQCIELKPHKIGGWMQLKDPDELLWFDVQARRNAWVPKCALEDRLLQRDDLEFLRVKRLD